MPCDMQLFFFNPKALVSKNTYYWKENNLLAMRGSRPAAEQDTAILNSPHQEGKHNMLLS